MTTFTMPIWVVIALGAADCEVATPPSLHADAGDQCTFLTLGHAQESVSAWPLLCIDRAGCYLAGRSRYRLPLGGQDQGMSMVV